jgi:hypothetical protein
MRGGKRDLSDTFFIEPTTGRSYSIADAPYYSVEGIWNNVNFWINLDTGRAIDEINFDFVEDATGEWEYVMIMPGNKRRNEDEDGGDN